MQSMSRPGAQSFGNGPLPHNAHTTKEQTTSFLPMPWWDAKAVEVTCTGAPPGQAQLNLRGILYGDDAEH